jgi:squalene cyclase
LVFFNGISSFNVSFLTKVWLTDSITAILAGIVIYANRTYLNQRRNKIMAFVKKDFTSRGSWAWMTGIVLTSFTLFFTGFLNI